MIFHPNNLYCSFVCNSAVVQAKLFYVLVGMASTACFVIVSKNDIPIYEAEVGSAPKVCTLNFMPFLCIGSNYNYLYGYIYNIAFFSPYAHHFSLLI